MTGVAGLPAIVQVVWPYIKRVTDAVRDRHKEQRADHSVSQAQNEKVAVAEVDQRGDHPARKRHCHQERIRVMKQRKQDPGDNRNAGNPAFYQPVYQEPVQ